MLLISSVAKQRNFPKVSSPFSLRILMSKGGHAILAVALPVILIGGIVGGIVTPTEAAAVAVIFALTVAVFIYRTMTV